MLRPGLSHTSGTIVSESLTAKAMGSGDISVFATPAMTALMENAAMLAVAEHLNDGETTVGGHMETSHMRPSPLGVEITATATLTRIDGRKLYFTVEARQGEAIIGSGTHLRYIVNRENFMSKINKTVIRV